MVMVIIGNARRSDGGQRRTYRYAKLDTRKLSTIVGPLFETPAQPNRRISKCDLPQFLVEVPAMLSWSP